MGELKRVIPDLDYTDITIREDNSSADDTLREAISVVEEEGHLVMKVNVSAEVRVPLSSLLGYDEDEMAKMVGERMHLDIWYDILPIMKRKLKEWREFNVKEAERQ